MQSLFYILQKRTVGTERRGERWELKPKSVTVVLDGVKEFDGDYAKMQWAGLRAIEIFPAEQKRFSLDFLWKKQGEYFDNGIECDEAYLREK